MFLRRVIVGLKVSLLAACAAPTPARVGPPIQAPQLTEIFFIPADGARLPLTQWRPPDEAGPPRGVVLMLHGLGLHGGVFSPLARALAQRGLVVYAYDHRGFGGAPDTGDWFGGDQLAADARAAIRLLRARHPGLPITLLGESMGAAVSMLAATQGREAGDGSAPDRLALSAPAVWGRATMAPWLVNALEIGGRLIPWFPATSQGTGRIPTDNLDALRQLRRDPLVIRSFSVGLLYGVVDLMDAASASAPGLPEGSLILVGGKDRIVPRNAFAAFLDRASPQARARFYPEGWHLLFTDQQAEAVVEDVAAWALGAPPPTARSTAEAAAALRAAQSNAPDPGP